MSRRSLLDLLSDDQRKLLRRSGEPRRVEPMKAVLHDQPFSDPDWIYERKLDGIRCIAIKGGGEVRLLSRNALPLDARFPAIKRLEDFRFADNPSVPQATIAALAEGSWIDDRDSVILIGDSGPLSHRPPRPGHWSISPSVPPDT